MKIRNERYLLRGKADYCCWYDGVERAATNLVVVRDSRASGKNAGISKCPGFMGKKSFSFQKRGVPFNVSVSGCTVYYDYCFGTNYPETRAEGEY